MSNHFHILLEVPPMPENGISDGELQKRLSAIYTEAFVATVAKELKEARKTENQRLVDEIHARFTYRMHDLSEFMKTLLQRFCPRSTLAARSAISSSGNGFLEWFAIAHSAFGAGRDGLRSGGLSQEQCTTKQVTIVQQPGSFRVIAHPPTPQSPQWPDILAE